jgi:RNA polymerase sigma-70 factor (ECF subfamily)
LAEPDESLLPARQAELHESLSLAFLTLLEALTPLERAVFLLREVFDYEYAEIADIVGKEEATCRQMLSRARKHISEHRPRFKPTPEAHERILNQFIQTVSTGDLDGLMQLLSEDVTLWADGGGKARGAVLHPLHGRQTVARFMIASTRLAPENSLMELAEVNGELALIVRADKKPFIVLSIVVDQERVTEIRAIGNPDKLKWLGGRVNSEEEQR